MFLLVPWTHRMGLELGETEKYFLHNSTEIIPKVFMTQYTLDEWLWIGSYQSCAP